MHSGLLSHVLSEVALFLPLFLPSQDDRGGSLGRAKLHHQIVKIRSEHRETSLQVRFFPSTSYHPDEGRIPDRTSTGQPVLGNGDGGKDAIPTPRFLISSLTGKSFDPMEERI